MTMQTEAAQKTHRRAVRFFWGVLIAATAVSLLGNVAHALMPYIPTIVIRVGAATVPPVVLLAAVHGIAVAVRAGVSGTVYRCAVGAVAVIGIGAFTLSFLALRDLMISIGYSASTSWMFPAIIDTAVAVSTLMLVALGDKPQSRTRSAKPTSFTSAQTVTEDSSPARRAKTQVRTIAASRSVQDSPVSPVQSGATGEDADVAAMLVKSKVTTQPAETVIAVLGVHRDGASINAAAKAAGVNYRTAQRIINGASKMSEQYAVAC
jgi:hypothetical protein